MDGVVEIEGDILLGMERAGPCDQVQGEIVVDVPGTPLVRAGEGQDGDRRGEASVVKLGGDGIRASDRIAQAVAARELGERRGTEPLSSVQVVHTTVAPIAADDAGEGHPRDELQDLREDSPTAIHVRTQ